MKSHKALSEHTKAVAAFVLKPSKRTERLMIRAMRTLIKSHRRGEVAEPEMPKVTKS